MQPRESRSQYLLSSRVAGMLELSRHKKLDKAESGRQQIRRVERQGLEQATHRSVSGFAAASASSTHGVNSQRGKRRASQPTCQRDRGGG